MRHTTTETELMAEITKLTVEVLRLKIALDAALNRVTSIKTTVEAL